MDFRTQTGNFSIRPKFIIIPIKDIGVSNKFVHPQSLYVFCRLQRKVYNDMFVMSLKLATSFFVR